MRPEASARIENVLNNDRIFVPLHAAERARLLEEHPQAVILIGDGMMESPRARWYYQYLSGTPGKGEGKENSHGIILTGHTASGSFGQHLLGRSGQKDVCSVWHRVYKLHQGLPDVRRMLVVLPSKQVVLVHAAKPQTDLVCNELIKEGWAGHRNLLKAIHSLEPEATLTV